MKHIFKFFNKKLFAWAICLLIVLSILAAPLVNAGTGSGDGTGGGKGNPLYLAESSPTDGEQDVPVAIKIQLTFNKNVVHMTVHDENKQCFALCTADGIAVPTEVVMADDQMEPEKRRDVMLKPHQELATGTTYIVRVAPDLRSKSGVTLGEEAVVTFTTQGASPAATTAPASPSGDNTGSVQEADTKDAILSGQGITPVSSEPEKESDTVEKPAAEQQIKEEEALTDIETEITEPSKKSDPSESTAAAQSKSNSVVIPLVVVLLLLYWLGYRFYTKHRAQ